MTEKTNVTRELSKLQQEVTSLHQEVLVLSKEVSKTHKTESRPKQALLFSKSLLGIAADLSALIIPVATWYLAFSSFISIPPTNSLQANKPLTIPFVIQNNSLINLRDLNVVINIASANGASVNLKEVEFSETNDSLPVLSSNSSHTILFNFPFPVTSINNADMAVEISYKALFFKKKFKQKFRFVAVPGQEGFYNYYPMQSKF